MLWSLIVAGVTVLLLALHLHHRKRKLDIPGPYQLPILCNLIDTFRHKHRLQDYMLEQASKSPKGTFHFVLPFGGDTDVMVTDPPSVEYILKTNFENFTKGPHFKDKLQTLLGDGIFNTDGQPWKEQRCSNLMIGEIAFGFNVDSMHKDCSFSQAFDAAQECAVDRFLWPFWKFTPSPMASYVKILNDFAANLIKERRQDPDVRDRNDLLSRYMCMDGVDHSDAHLRDIVMNFMIAGRDTTAQTLSWLFYNLSRNPDKEAELLKEIDSFDDGLPDYDELRHMKYIMGAINETLRLCPPVPVDPKYVVKDDVLPNGYKVPAGVNVAWSMYCMGRMEKYWDRPLEFLPERWLDPEKNKERHPFLFIPFQAGPRTCLGQNMAYLEAKVMTFMILKSYRLELHDPENQKSVYHFTTSKKKQHCTGLPTHMGINQSIPPHRIEPPRFRIGPPGKPMPRGNQYCSMRPLFWRLANSNVLVRLETDVALCFGDVYRVLLLLHHDDAELDRDGPDQRHLLPARHQRTQFVDGVPVGDDDGHRHDASDDEDEEDDEPQTRGRHHPTQVIWVAGNWMPFTRQIAHNSALQKDSTVNMMVPGPRRTAWRALPRQHTVGGRGSWALPGGWDDGLRDVVANHDALQLTGRSEFIHRNLIKIVEHDGMRLISHQYDRGDGKDAKGMVEQLMARVTDNVDDAPLDFFVALRPPIDAAIYHNRCSGGGLAPSIEFVVHVQLPPTYPLASERYRMLTPILHPFVAPLWPDNVDGGRDDDKRRAWLEGGRMAFASGIKEQATLTPWSTNAEGFAEVLAWFRDESLLDPVGCASRFVEKSPDDATTEMKRWASPDGGEKMARRASRLAEDGGVVRWRPELHAACPLAVRAEVRTLLLVRQRAQADMPVDGSGSSPMAEMPEEVVRHIIDALLGLHLSSASSFLYFSA